MKAQAFASSKSGAPRLPGTNPKKAEIRKLASGVYEYYHDYDDRWYPCKDQIEAKRLYDKQKKVGDRRACHGGHEEWNGSNWVYVPFPIQSKPQKGDKQTTNGLDYVYNGSNWVPMYVDKTLSDLLAD